MISNRITCGYGVMPALATVLVLVLGLGLGLGCGPARAAGVDAGTLIENRAVATFNTPQGGQTVQSNTVTIRVDEILDVALASRDSGPVNASGANVVLGFSLTNTGNAPERFRLIADPAVPGNQFDLAIDGIAVDSNGNGIYDAGVDLELSAPETSAEIAAEGVLTVFVLASVPGGTADSARSTVSLQASAVTRSGTPGDTVVGAGQGGSDAVVGANGARASAQGEVKVVSQSVTLTKSARIADPFGGSSAVPGATISYSILVAVDGTGSVDNLTVTDPVPPGTTYVPGSLSLNAASLSDAPNDDSGQVSAGIVSVALGTVAVGVTNTIQFDVRIEE